jgi:hypothetical protein
MVWWFLASACTSWDQINGRACKKLRSHQRNHGLAYSH